MIPNVKNLTGQDAVAYLKKRLKWAKKHCPPGTSAKLEGEMQEIQAGLNLQIPVPDDFDLSTYDPESDGC